MPNNVVEFRKAVLMKSRDLIRPFIYGIEFINYSIKVYVFPPNQLYPILSFKLTSYLHSNNHKRKLSVCSDLMTTRDILWCWLHDWWAFEDDMVLRFICYLIQGEACSYEGVICHFMVSRWIIMIWIKLSSQKCRFAIFANIINAQFIFFIFN